MPRKTLIALVSAVVVVLATYVLGPDIESVEEHYFPTSAHLLAVGDVFFDRSIREYAQNYGFDYIFSCVDKELSKYDLVFGNLESPITNFPSKSIGTKPGGDDNYTFTSPPESAQMLRSHNIALVNIGNNHVMNFSREGLIQTESYLDAAGVAHFGDPDKSESERVARLEIGGIPLSFVNWSDWTSDKTDHTVAQVRAEVNAGRTVLVYTHWGEEYQPPLPRMKALAHSFIDAGASIVIGSHPHIVQEHEFYKGKWIYYSLGNFIFDQYWSNAVRHGLALDLTISEAGVEVKERPVVLGQDRRTCFEN